MSVAAPAPACIRTGFCCQLLGIKYSPRTLRDIFREWQNWRHGREDEWQKWAKENGTEIPDDIELIYPMLAGRNVGKRDVSEGDEETRWHYYYGPCRNLDYVIEGGKRLAACAIHENKPSMCSGYPFYAGTKDLAKDPNDPNPGFSRGCGYNTDAQAGTTEGEMRGRLVPLDEDEL